LSPQKHGALGDKCRVPGEGGRWWPSRPYNAQLLNPGTDAGYLGMLDAFDPFGYTAERRAERADRLA
jgi:hypothetical protein